MEVVVVLAVDPLDVRDVFEALGREVEDTRALACEHRVDADRRADDDEADIGRIEPGRAERIRDRGDRIGRVGRHLGDEPAAARVVDCDEVGERATGIDPHSDSHAGDSTGIGERGADGGATCPARSRSALIQGQALNEQTPKCRDPGNEYLVI